MHRTDTTALSSAIHDPLNLAHLRLVLTACFLMQATGCVHGTAEQAPAPRKSPIAEKQAVPAQQPQRTEQFEKAKAVEKKPAALQEKKPGKKPEQSDESIPDLLAPPPPLKPPNFGGAGG